MKISVVTSLFHSAVYLDEFYRRMTESVRKLTDDYELIFVNDGSPDASLDIITNKFKVDDKVKIINLSRNFGHHKAMMTGLENAVGDRVFLVDCDLEEDPELILEFQKVFDENQVDVVYGVQKRRKGQFFSRLSGYAFYLVFNYLSQTKISVNQMTVRLMSQRYVQSLVRHQDQEIFMPGLMTLTGYPQVPLSVDKNYTGNTTYTFRKKVSMLVNSVTSFSSKPLVLIFYAGLFIFITAFLAAIYLLIKRVFLRVYLTGWPSMMVSIWLLGGITILGLGIIGIYLAKIFSETKKRPFTIIQDILSHPQPTDERTANEE